MATNDKLVYEMSNDVEGMPSIFVRKDWVSILDNNNSNYSSNQLTISTSAISNSNKYASYREGYLSVPLLLTLTNSAIGVTGSAFPPATAATSADYSLGLKNWFGHIFHSISVDMNGTTIIQTTPFTSLWNCFRLMTTFSWNDVLTQGASIGFFPDVATSFAFSSSNYNANGVGTTNNQNVLGLGVVSGAFNDYYVGNSGFVRRQQYINFDPDALTGLATNDQTYSTLLDATNCQTAYKSYVSTKVNGAAASGSITTSGVFQISVMANIYLRHLHPFFDKIPLMKGAFFNIVCNINNSSVQFTGTQSSGTTFSAVSVQSALGGVNPLMIASGFTNNGNFALPSGTYIASVAVGSRVLNASQLALSNITTGKLATSVSLNIPLYSFAPVFESAYLSNPVKSIVYSDIYNYIQYNIASGNTYNFLATSGLANVLSVLVLPYLTTTSNGGVVSPLQSPFDTAGATTSPLCLQGNFNIQLSGQNLLYNTQKFTYEEFLQQLAGCNSINGNQIDGLCSSLVNQLEFETLYNYYYVRADRMLEVERSVPKSVTITGQNLSKLAVDLYVFCEYQQSIQVDILTGQRI